MKFKSAVWVIAFLTLIPSSRASMIGDGAFASVLESLNTIGVRLGPDLGCANGIARKVHVIGEENRRFATAQDKDLFSPVGILTGSDGGRCTATLVGRRLILTAAHCVVSPDGTSLGTFWFEPASGSPRKRSKVQKKVWLSKQAPYRGGNDWAVAILEDPLGDRAGYADILSFDSIQDLPNKLTSLGYDREGNGQLLIEDGCRFVRSTSVDQKQMQISCDLNQGASGGPLFIKQGSRLKIAGIKTSMNSYLSDPDMMYQVSEDDWVRTNIAVPIQNDLLDLVTRLRKQ